MRHLVVAFATLLLAACSTAPSPRHASPAASPAPARAPERRASAPDSVVQFLLTAAATDFHAHRPPDPARFRDVRVGRVVTSAGEEQYMLCGQFLPAQAANPEWTPFATIKTSDYEHWIGARAADFCRGSSVIWDQRGDLSSSLQDKLDSLR